MMVKTIAPAALVLLATSATASFAAQCPSGQIYRVSLHVCAPKSANMQFVHASPNNRGAKPAKNARSPASNESAANNVVDQPEVAPLPYASDLRREEASDAQLIIAPTAAPAKPSPYGGLPTTLSFQRK